MKLKDYHVDKKKGAGTRLEIVRRSAGIWKSFCKAPRLEFSNLCTPTAATLKPQNSKK